MSVDVGSSSTSGSRSFAASPRFHATVPASTQPPVLSSMKVVPPVGAARRGVSSMKTRGPRCKTSARAASSSSCGRLRWAGGGSHRLAVPGRGSCLLVGVSTGSGVTPTRSKRLDDGRCWTQRRPPAGSSKGRCLVPSGLACEMVYRSRARVPPVARRGGHGYAIDRGRVLLGVVSLRAFRRCSGSAKWRPSMAWAGC